MLVIDSTRITREGIRNLLIERGSKFICDKISVSEWHIIGLTVSEMSRWVNNGFWCPYTVKELHSRGFTPEVTEGILESLYGRCGDSIQYGCLIYALCSGRITMNKFLLDISQNYDKIYFATR